MGWDVFEHCSRNIQRLFDMISTSEPSVWWVETFYQRKIAFTNLEMTKVFASDCSAAVILEISLLFLTSHPSLWKQKILPRFDNFAGTVVADFWNPPGNRLPSFESVEVAHLAEQTAPFQSYDWLLRSQLKQVPCCASCIELWCDTKERYQWSNSIIMPFKKVFCDANLPATFDRELLS